MINSITLTPQSVFTNDSVLISVSMTWEPITYNQLLPLTHNSLTVNQYDDFEGGVA